MARFDDRQGWSDELDEIASLSRPLVDVADLDPLMERCGDAAFVLLGEASHGTADYYRWRAEITKRLVAQGGFSFIAVEGDWPHCAAVNRWVKGRAAHHRDARAVLGEFGRWPTWMWANEEVAEFIGWLRDHNQRTGHDVGFYGLDVYSLWDSLRIVLEYLQERRPEAVEAAIAAARCFEPYHEDPQRYAWATRMVPTSCEDEVLELLGEIHRRPVDDHDPEAELDAVQNAEVLAGAEQYYRAMVRADSSSWNVRDHHMADTLDRLVQRHGAGAKAIVWEHNTHVGDARATDMATAGMVNVGQLVRERHGDHDVVLVGFGSHHGTVIAGSRWGANPQRMPVPDAPAGSHEDLLHRHGDPSSLLVFGDDRDTPWLSSRRGHRAIGVVYNPSADRYGNWVPTTIGQRYDAFCYLDTTEALHPLAVTPVGAERDTEPWTT